MFISYLREDVKRVDRLAHELREYGIDVWLDRDQIKPGQRWADEIRTAIRESGFCIACFSRVSATRSRTYMNKELTMAIEELLHRPPGQAWFIPVLLDRVEVPDFTIGGEETLRSLQCVALHDDWERGVTSILSVIKPDAVRVSELISAMPGDSMPEDSMEERLRAIRSLAEFGERAAPAVRALIDALKYDYLRTKAIDVLYSIGPAARPALPELTALATTEPHALRRAYRMARLDIPGEAECFQDREVAGDLSQAFDREKVVVLTGTGGVGKTQLAAHYARDALDDGLVDLVVWITAASRKDVVDGYARAGVEVAGGERGDIQQAVKCFRNRLEITERWLMVLDDVTDPADLDGLWPSKRTGARVLVTTRRRDLRMVGEGQLWIDVDCFSPDEAVAYLTAKLAAHDRVDDPEQIAGLADDLCYLPLALAQAAAYMVEKGLDCGSYRRRLPDPAVRLQELAPDRFPDDYSVKVAATWSLSIDRADQLDPQGLARPMLELASMLAPNGIPVDALTSQPALAYLTDHPTTHTAGRKRKWDANEARDALQCLRRLSLAELEPDDFSPRTVRVHGLTQRATRVTLSEDRRDLAARAAADALMVSWPDAGQDTIRAQALRANIDALVACAAGALWQDARGQDGVHPVLLRAGQSLGEAGMVSGAFTYWKQLHDTAIDRLGADHSDTARIWLRLLHWTGESGDTDGAIAGYTQLLDDLRRSLGDDHPDVLQARDDLAHWRGEAGYSAYVQINQLKPKQKSQPAVKQKSQTAVNQMFQAAADYAALLADRSRLIGDHHPYTMRTLNEQAHWLAEAAHAARDLDVDGAERTQQAIHYYSELLTIQRDLGDERAVLETLGNLAHWTGENGDTTGALDRYAELLTAQERVLGKDHAETLKMRDHLAHWTGENGDTTGALDRYTELLTDQERVLGRDQPDTLHTRERIAHWRARSGDVSTAIGEYTAVLADQRRVLGNDHPDTQWTENQLK